MIYSYENRIYLIRFNPQKSVKIILVIAILLITGIIGLDKKPKIHFASILHYDFSLNKLEIMPLPEGTGLLPVILKPYLAARFL